jgi:hypothetical protein
VSATICGADDEDVAGNTFVILGSGISATVTYKDDDWSCCEEKVPISIFQIPTTSQIGTEMESTVEAWSEDDI